MADVEKELARRVKALKKAVISSESAFVILPMLEKLKNDFSPTEDMLRSTKAGMVVGKLRSNANKDIARVCGEIVNKWKKGVEAAKQGKRQRSLGASPSAGTPKNDISPKPTHGNGPEYCSPYQGNPNDRHFKNDKVDLNRTGDKTRDGCIGLLYNGLAYRNTESIDQVLTFAMAIEAAAWRELKGSEGPGDYTKKVRSLMTLMKRKDNRQLGRRILKRDITVDRLVVMTDKELASEEQRRADEALERENIRMAQVPMAEKSISDALKCGKCGQKKVSYSQAQTRSADEPMTTFCECTVCGNRWKFS